MKKLRNHKELEKIDKFHIMALLMAIFTILSTGVIGLHGAAVMMTSIDRWWPIWWLWDAVCRQSFA